MSDDVKKRTIGIVLYSGFEVLDVFGPAEMFGVLRELPECRDALEVMMVVEAAGEIVSSQGTRVVADVSFADAPELDIVLVPGASGRGVRLRMR